MKIVVLDGGTLRQPLEAWKSIYSLGDVDFYENTPSDSQVISQRCKDANIVLTNKVVLDGETIRSMKKLKLISTLATGYNQVDTETAKDCGITVCNVPAYSTEAVAQQVMAYILHFTNQVAAHNDLVQNGCWAREPFFSFWNAPIRELHTMSIGIVGYGAIGQRVAHLGTAFGARINVHSRTRRIDADVNWMGLDELLEGSDVVTVHCPLTEDTYHLMNDERIAKMKRGAYLINTSRGNVVEADALIRALENGHLGGAAVDVVSEEPMPLSHPYNSTKNLVITPHMAWAGVDALARLLQITFDNTKLFITGTPQNIVNR